MGDVEYCNYPFSSLVPSSLKAVVGLFLLEQVLYAPNKTPNKTRFPLPQIMGNYMSIWLTTLPFHCAPST